jgi:hypothetical protein
MAVPIASTPVLSGKEVAAMQELVKSVLAKATFKIGY